MLLASEALEINRVCMDRNLINGHYTLIMLSGLNALIVQASTQLSGPVLASVPLGTFTGMIESEELSSDNSNDDSTNEDQVEAAIFFSVIFTVFLCCTAFIICSVRYVKHVARKDKASKVMIKRQELQIKRMREAWMLEWDEITLLKKIGQGVAGEVWKGCMNETNWDVAVKIVLGSEDIETGDDAEISFLRQCRHPRLVMFLGCGRCKSNNDIFLVLEMMECSVDTVLWRQKANQATGNQVHYIRLLQDWSVRLRLISHIAAGMEYLHIEHEAIHRDLKTPNVLISFDQNNNRLLAKISDFGLARVFESQMDSRKEERKRQLSSSNDKVKRFISAEMTGSAGTPLWMAPELAKSDDTTKAYTQAVDVYAFGIILWEFLERARPYFNQHFQLSSDLLAFVANGGRPKYVSNDMPSDYVTLMKNCWNQVALRRPRFDNIVKSVDRIILMYETDSSKKKKNVESKRNESTKDRSGSTERYSPLV